MENVEVDQSKKKTVPATPCEIVTDRDNCIVLKTDTLDAEPPADLGCDKPTSIYSTTDCGEIKTLFITKPQLLPRQSVAEASDVISTSARPTNGKREWKTRKCVWPMERGEGEETTG